ncbi:hypothetical protein A5893_13800 [Pedobacter psychrophilus]|uniref:DUF4595 domain-containing protein n=1 Tax=Pedobacter psychrophilus TaxID=1826909 RepID=A0A179DC53_9SPHI|nr:hypothetical protein [Pedobacter psychrophilus]OAQ38494.1 hypothetical protein A5893_13800 [Pedobacter psychrophilus]
MNKIYALLIIFLIITFSCRKDNSTFKNGSSGNASTGSCLISGGTVDGENLVLKYQLDSIIAEATYSLNSDDNQYLIQETPKKFIHTNKTKELKNADYRVYLNSFGAVEKEVKITLNADNKTFTESSSQSNIYTYNSKNLLVKMIGKLDDDPSVYGTFDLTYDAKNRISEITLKDDTGAKYFTYNNFKFLDQPKKNNLVTVGLTDTFGNNFIPSLRNAYVTHYETTFEGISLEPDTYDFKYTFGNSNIKVDGKYILFGFAIDFTVNYNLICK